ncbi:hypothetical protein ACG7TL_002067 [Trametes sanguinea]
MSDVISFSLLQLISVFSFLTSVLAVVCVNSGSLQKLAHRVDSGVDSSSASDIAIAPGKHLWNWSGLPVSFSIGSLLGEDDQTDTAGYVGGSELSRMDWQVGQPRLVTELPDSRVPISMAKLIMSRHYPRIPPTPHPTRWLPNPSSHIVDMYDLVNFALSHVEDSLEYPAITDILYLPKATQLDNPSAAPQTLTSSYCDSDELVRISRSSLIQQRELTDLRILFDFTDLSLPPAMAPDVFTHLRVLMRALPLSGSLELCSAIHSICLCVLEVRDITSSKEDGDDDSQDGLDGSDENDENDFETPKSTRRREPAPSALPC